MVRQVTGHLRRAVKAGASATHGQVLKCFFVVLVGVSFALGAAETDAANALHLKIDKLTHPQLAVQSLDLRISPELGETPASLNLRAASMRITTLGQTLREVEFDCAPAPVAPAGAGAAVIREATAQPAAPVAQPETSPETTPVAGGSGRIGTDTAGTPTPSIRWQCEGPLRWRGGGRKWSLAWQADEALTSASIRLIQGTSEIALRLPLAGDALAVSAKRVPASWLEPVMPTMDWQAGRIDGRVELSQTRAGASRWRGEVNARSLSAEAPGGSIALAGVDIGGAVDITSAANDELRVDAAPTLTKGELLAGPVYIAWPAESAMAMEIAAIVTGGDWQFDRIRIDDGGFQVDARGLLKPADSDWLQSFQADVSINLASRYERYLEGAMASLGQPGLKADGSIKASITLGAGAAVEAFDSTLLQVALRHPDDRYAIDGIGGTLAFRETADPAPVDLRWSALTLGSLDFGAGRLRGQSHNGEIRASHPIALNLFGGSVVTRDLVYRPVADEGDRFQASMDVVGVDIAGMAGAFGWPAFTGRMDGTFPKLRYAGDVLGVDGEILIKAFDGELRIARLSVERPFGVAPALAGEITLTNLDLQPMTEVFGLGRIEGRLNGQIAGLRLLDWNPTAFDARLRTADSGRRRISQLAVEQLTQIGGGGGAAGIQGRLLGVFDSFGYRRIGLSCKLANNVCEMGGVDESAGGYTILLGSGLPLITIRGFQKRVDWPVLVERLKAVVAGQRPVVD